MRHTYFAKYVNLSVIAGIFVHTHRLTHTCIFIDKPVGEVEFMYSGSKLRYKFVSIN